MCHWFKSSRSHQFFMSIWKRPRFIGGFLLFLHHFCFASGVSTTRNTLILTIVHLTNAQKSGAFLHFSDGKIKSYQIENPSAFSLRGTFCSLTSHLHFNLYCYCRFVGKLKFDCIACCSLLVNRNFLAGCCYQVIG